MKLTVVLFVLFCLALGGMQAQRAAAKVTGTYVGQYKWEGGHAVIKIKKNHRYTIKKYDWSGKYQSAVEGTWHMDETKLVLKETSGSTLILERDREHVSDKDRGQKEGWYIYGTRAYSYDGYFIQGLSEKTFKKMLASRGC